VVVSQNGNDENWIHFSRVIRPSSIKLIFSLLNILLEHMYFSMIKLNIVRYLRVPVLKIRQGTLRTLCVHDLRCTWNALHAAWKKSAIGDMYTCFTLDFDTIEIPTATVEHFISRVGKKLQTFCTNDCESTFLLPPSTSYVHFLARCKAYVPV